MAKTIYQRLEATMERVRTQGGEGIVMCRDGESDFSMLSVLLMHKESATGLFIELFEEFPELIPKAMCAASQVLDFGFDAHDGDDDSDDDGPTEDGVPIGGCGADCTFCVN